MIPKPKIPTITKNLEHYFDDINIAERGGLVRYDCKCGWRTKFKRGVEAASDLNDHIMSFVVKS